eukprot:GHVU01120179.1.p2 GENE.GHVU01120179.1~~GHVU01120179.1.p2  ORF type:complete len:136 (-),score=30.51 GHVU01120179.1:880-1239(-)
MATKKEKGLSEQVMRMRFMKLPQQEMEKADLERRQKIEMDELQWTDPNWIGRLPKKGPSSTTAMTQPMFQSRKSFNGFNPTVEDWMKAIDAQIKKKERAHAEEDAAAAYLGKRRKTDME